MQTSYPATIYIYILDEDDGPTLRYGRIYIGETDQVTDPNGRSPSGGPEGPHIVTRRVVD